MNSVIANSTELAIVRFCAEEVQRQGDGPIEVWWMVEAWLYALDDAKRIGCLLSKMEPSLGQIQRWGHLIERERNPDIGGGWRRVPVRVGSYLAPAPLEVGPLMTRWREEVVPNATPEEAYREFQHIHPFVDGNGRTGKVIYNALKGTLSEPIMPPDFFGGIRNP